MSFLTKTPTKGLGRQREPDSLFPSKKEETGQRTTKGCEKYCILSNTDNWVHFSIPPVVALPLDGVGGGRGFREKETLQAPQKFLYVQVFPWRLEFSGNDDER